jgi:glycosyltransferase involved in cell wall biosynthesis
LLAISMLTLRPGEMGGSETYAAGLAAALAKHGTLEYLCLVPPAAPDAGNGLPTVVVPEYRPARRAPARAAAMAFATLRSRAIRRRLPTLGAVHYPFTIPVPVLAVPAAITLHDVLHRDHPELWPTALRAFRVLAYDRAARRSALVIVPSGYVRARVAQLLRIPAERIRAVHSGIDHDLFRPGREEREPFLLYPARPWPHKNHARLFEAFALVRRERPELELVLTGGGHEWRALPAGVRVRGLVRPEELASLYRRAAVLVFPSLHEGFGQPPLEAMACGCPVAVARATSLPEVCGDAAVYFDPRSPEDIAVGILRALAQREELERRGIEHARAFTWERSARAHEAHYRELLSFSSA